ncbi:Ctr copper transporter family-domain-containing protein [Peziza echinospora]|nr:Ctr copper transporter family-domain-containing protein [Peziza echinospora]
MDHSHHEHMHHGGAAGTAGGDMMEEAYRCSMNMLFTWNTQNLCLVFRWWHITGGVSLFFSLLGVVVLSAGYEWLRDFTRRFEARIDATKNGGSEETSSLLPNAGRPTAAASRSRYSLPHILKGGLYGLQVFYSFFIMLLFMTYNGWVMIAVAVGAFLGYIVWGGNTAAKSVACH